jgi:hypothetical protein
VTLLVEVTKVAASKTRVFCSPVAFCLIKSEARWLIRPAPSSAYGEHTAAHWPLFLLCDGFDSSATYEYSATQQR